MLNRTLLPALALTGFAVSAPAQLQCGDFLWSIDYGSASLRQVDILTGATLNQIGLSDTQYTINYFTSLAVHPMTGAVFVVVEYDDTASPAPPQITQGQNTSSGRYLASVDLNFMTTTPIGHLESLTNPGSNDGSFLSDIAFDGQGVLWGLEGDGGFQPDSLYVINPATGVGAPIMTLSSPGSSNNGEAMAFDRSTGLLYRCSGAPSAAQGVEFFEIDVNTQTETQIQLSGFVLDEVISMCGLVDGNFVLGDLNWNFAIMNTLGEVRSLGFTSFYAMGLAYGIQEPNTAPHSRLYGMGCSSSPATVRTGMLLGSGCPSAGNSIAITMLNGVDNALSIVGVGTGQSALPLPPAPCDVQIWPAVTSFVLFSDSNGDLAFPINVPAGVWNFDWTFQIGQLTPGSDISMTNALAVAFR